jgi:hypothetical protein
MADVRPTKKKKPGLLGSVSDRVGLAGEGEEFAPPFSQRIDPTQMGPLGVPSLADIALARRKAAMGGSGEPVDAAMNSTARQSKGRTKKGIFGYGMMGGMGGSYTE